MKVCVHSFVRSLPFARLPRGLFRVGWRRISRAGSVDASRIFQGPAHAASSVRPWTVGEKMVSVDLASRPCSVVLLFFFGFCP